MDTLLRLNSAEFSPFIFLFSFSFFPPAGASGHISLDLDLNLSREVELFYVATDICGEVSFAIQFPPSEAFLFHHIWVTFFSGATPWHVSFFKVRVIPYWMYANQTYDFVQR